MEGDGDAPPPFWLQSSNSLHHLDYNRRPRRRLSRASSFLLNSSAFLIVLLVIVLCFILIVIPKFVHFGSQLLRPQSVKKSWDSLNLVLVLFAIVCGFLSRNTGDDSKASFEDRSVSSKRTGKSNPTTPRRWYGYSDDRPTHYTLNRMRSSSSYPDLRLQESLLDAGDERWRFYDDTHVHNHRLPASDQLHRRREARPELEHEDFGARSTGFDRSGIREEVYSKPRMLSPPRSPPPPPPTLPPPPKTTPTVVKRRPMRTHKVHSHTPDGEIDRQHKNGDSDVADCQRIQLPPLSPPAFYQESEQKIGKNEKKRGGPTKEFWTTALRRRKKKQRQKSIESFETILSSQRPSTSSLPPASPPPPPPLPPPSVFQNLFSSKKGKGRKGQSLTLPEPPPPSIASSEPKPEIGDQNQLSNLHEPPMELERLSSINDEEYNTRIGGESPFHPIPPPPLPFKFARHGNFDSSGSNSSTPRAVSPDMEESEADGPPAAGQMRLLKDSATPMFCSSPDVNSKADKFIERFRADLKLQKMNSIKEKKARKRSNLGREPGPGPK
ncbi:uncharacterized protein C6orf132 homolog [Momordica charantia]|uniref:Uncharacterized protein C6orf132 homolog n=1 Tax=Momordica charantia TaxID=3673 RepID=A0A6J1CQ76_MOMCH|nr:uncharacterized protein C6orf132 homolog [Momordica charantia]